MRLYKREGSNVWWFDYYVSGKRVRESTKREVKSEAQAVMVESYKARLDTAQFGTNPEITVADAFDRVIGQAHGATRQSYELCKRKWLGLGPFATRWHLPEGILLSALDEGDLEDHIAARQDEGLKPNSINIEIRVLKVAHNAARRRFRANDDLQFTMVKGFTKTRFLTADEQQAVEDILRASEGPSYAKALSLYLFLKDTGVRLSEALNARWADLDCDRGLMEVYRIKTDSLSTVPMTHQVVDLLKRLSNQSAPFENMSRAIRLLRSTIDKVCNTDERVIRQRGRATIHTLRDTFASNLVKKGMSLHELAKLLGHTTAAMSAKYAHLESSDVAEKARRLMEG